MSTKGKVRPFVIQRGVTLKPLRLSHIALGCLVSTGCADKQIASRLGVSEAAVKSRIRRALAEVGARNLAELAALSRDILWSSGFLVEEGDSKECRFAPFCAYTGRCPLLENATGLR